MTVCALNREWGWYIPYTLKANVPNLVIQNLSASEKYLKKVAELNPTLLAYNTITKTLYQTTLDNIDNEDIKLPETLVIKNDVILLLDEL